MKNLFKKLLQTSIVSSVILIAFGMSLIVKAEITIVAISYTIGGILSLLGAAAALRYIRSINKIEKNELDIIYAVACIVLGVLIIKNPYAIQNTVLFIVGLIILINSATKLQYGLELKKDNNDIYLPTIIISALMAICGIFLMFRPDIASNLLGKIVGSLIVIYALLDLATTIVIKRTLNAIDESIKEADVVEIEEDTTKKKNKSKNKKEKEDTEDKE